jgi:hypothetical protein
VGAFFIPVRLTLAEICVSCLVEAAILLETADDTDAFLTALDTNHRVWLSLVDVALRNGWDIPDRRLAEFVMATSCKCGCGVADEEVEALIEIGHRTAGQLAKGRDVAGIRRRAELAWREIGRTHRLALLPWLLAEMARKARLARQPAPCPVIPNNRRSLVR